MLGNIDNVHYSMTLFQSQDKIFKQQMQHTWVQSGQLEMEKEILENRCFMAGENCPFFCIPLPLLLQNQLMTHSLPDITI